ncbi:4'-phosphopantetheinyl transferase family protein [Allorhodopirellula solitaria]|uniref:4'-phosphopantetheinyl transferase family protein n=1 Tax=Allorhodopirellula solitaria TaxID=2527987 RepID=UPI0011B68E98|nr:4'-phosphopantetheinyl transferase superfamily protein [Allorhodopirellula solitaria]
MSSRAHDPPDLSRGGVPHDVEVWHAPAALDEPGPTEQFCERLLLPDERVRADRFRVASARHQHVVGRGMARVLLSAGLCQTHEIGFRVLDHGKPVVATPPTACRSFNIAHTRGLVLCALGAPQAIGAPQPWLGVDVEWIDRRTDPELARRYFAPEEIRQLDAAGSEDEHRELFLRLWTLKEAFIKAIGTGMYTPLDQFAFENAATDQPHLVVRDPELMRGRRWRFETFSPRAGFVAAIAVGAAADGQAADGQVTGGLTAGGLIAGGRDAQRPNNERPPFKLSDFQTYVR